MRRLQEEEEEEVEVGEMWSGVELGAVMAVVVGGRLGCSLVIESQDILNQNMVMRDYTWNRRNN